MDTSGVISSSGVGRLNIYGGCYEIEPYPSRSVSDDAPHGYTVILSDVPGYPYQVVKKTNDVYACAYPDSLPDVPKDHPMYYAPTTCQVDVLEAAVREAAQELDEETIYELKMRASESGGTKFDVLPGYIYLYVVADMHFVPGDLEKDHLSMELTPVYSIWASTESDYGCYDFDEDENGDPYRSDCYKVQAAQELQIDKPVTVQLRTLPDDFVNDLLASDGVYVEHLKDGQKYIYDCELVELNSEPTPTALYDAADENSDGSEAGNGPAYNYQYYLEFTTQHGFSPFAVTTELPVATITGQDGVTTGYDSLQAAADAAKSGDKIVLHSGGQHALQFSATKAIKIINQTGREVTVTFNGEDKTLANEKSESFSYTKPEPTPEPTPTPSTSHGGGSSRNNSYAVSTPEADNGSVTVNNGSTAKKGDTVTITVKPDAGYEIDKVTVTDSKGNSISVTDKGDGKYSFIMPDGKVDVKATFVKAEVKPDQPSKTTFMDVPSNSWYADAADFVAQRGLMSGVGENLFGGSQNTTRAMLMTILARMDGQDVSGGSTWYDKAMTWAKNNGVSDGTMPEKNITREQLATMLYSYAKLKGIDTTQGGMAVREFSDYDSISSWAGQSMTWAVNAGILSGRGNNTLAPTAGATRAEMAVMLQQFVKLMEK
jgi:hypothetical protein